MKKNEINLGSLMYYIAKRWRMLLLLFLIDAAAVGGICWLYEYLTIHNPDSFAKRQESYTYKNAEYEAERMNLEKQYESKKLEFEDNRFYNANSPLMQLDPNAVWTGKMDILIDNGYEIMPQSTYQNENSVNWLNGLYSNYIDGGEFLYDLSLEHPLSFDERYFREVFTSKSGSGNKVISVEYLSKDKEDCEFVLNFLEKMLNKKKEVFCADGNEHELHIMNRTTYSEKDADLEKYQAEELTKCLRSENEVLLVEGELLELARQDKDLPALTMKEAAWGILKKTIISEIILFVLLVGFFCVRYLVADSIHTMEEFTEDIHPLCEIPEVKKKRLGKWLDCLLGAMFGVKLAQSEYEGRMASLKVLLSKLVKDKKDSTILVVGDITPAMKEKFAKEIEGDGKEFSVVMAGNFLLDSAMARKVCFSDNILLLVQNGKSSVKETKKMLTQLKTYQKELLGTVFLDADAIPR